MKKIYILLFSLAAFAPLPKNVEFVKIEESAKLALIDPAQKLDGYDPIQISLNRGLIREYVWSFECPPFCKNEIENSLFEKLLDDSKTFYPVRYKFNCYVVEDWLVIDLEHNPKIAYPLLAEYISSFIEGKGEFPKKRFGILYKDIGPESVEYQYDDCLMLKTGVELTDVSWTSVVINMSLINEYKLKYPALDKGDIKDLMGWISCFPNHERRFKSCLKVKDSKDVLVLHSSYEGIMSPPLYVSQYIRAFIKTKGFKMESNEEAPSKTEPKPEAELE
jgi:hypothetical protein